MSQEADERRAAVPTPTPTARAQPQPDEAPSRQPDRPSAVVEAWINPLDFPDVEWARGDEASPIGAEAILSFLCPPGTPNDADSLVERYKTISATGERLAFVPAEPALLDKLVWPLRSAKASFVLGNNLAVVALCGTVAEMMAVLLWHSDQTKLNGRELTETDEKRLFGSTFERLGQDRRVKILASFGIVTQDEVKDFDAIREKRNAYLHRWSQDHKHLSKDAEECFRAATGLVARVIGQGCQQDGTLRISERIEHYLLRVSGYWPRPGRTPQRKQ